MKSICISLFSVIFVVLYTQVSCEWIPGGFKGFKIPMKPFFADPRDLHFSGLGRGPSTPKFPTINITPEVPVSETNDKSKDGNTELNQSDLQKNIKPFDSLLPPSVGSEKKEGDTTVPETNLSQNAPVVVNSDETKKSVDQNQGASTTKAVQENDKQEKSTSVGVPALQDASSHNIEEDMQQSASEDSYQNAKPLNDEGQSLLPPALVSNEEGKVNSTGGVLINTFLQPPSEEAANTYNQEEVLQKKIS